MMRLVFIFCLGLIGTNLVFSQRYSGHNFSGYSGVYGIQENPASFVTKRPKWDVNIVGLSLYAYTDYGFIANQSVLSASGMNVINTTDSIPRNINDETDARLFLNKYDGTATGLMFQSTVHLPSFVFRIKNMSMGLFTNARIGADAMEVPNFFNYSGLKDIIDFKPYKIDPFIVNTMAWGEIGLHFGYAHELQNENILSVGINPKYLIGYEAAYIQNKSTYSFVRERDTFFASDANLSIGFATGASTNSNSYNFGGTGSGFGLDVGAEYMIPTKDDDENPSPHFMKFGLAFKDMGSITFDKNTQVHDYAVNSNEFGILKQITYNKSHNYDVIKRLSAQVYNGDSLKSLKAREFTMNTPMSVSAYWDYNFRKDFYVNLFATRRIKTLNQQLTAPNIFMVSARYEKRWFEAGMSASLTEDNWFGVGSYVRLGLLTIGSDHINTFFFSQPKLRGSDFYMSIKIMPFGKAEKSDDDDRYRGSPGGKTGCPRMSSW
jgi:Family of unknown function (DUF5723)